MPRKPAAFLNRLVGYTLSPLLWKKIAGGLSAGRVQSVAVKVVVNREKERRAFRKGSYWDLKATLLKDKNSFGSQTLTPWAALAWLQVTTLTNPPGALPKGVKLF